MKSSGMRRKFSVYDFDTKMRLNAFVIGELVNAIHPDAKGDQLRQAQNEVAIRLSEADDLHRLIGELATALKAETDRQRLPSMAARVASRWLRVLR